MMEFEKDIEAYQINIEHFKSLEFHAHTLKTILDESLRLGSRVYVCGVGESELVVDFLVNRIENSIKLDASVDKVAKYGLGGIFSEKLKSVALKEDVVIGVGINSNDKSLKEAFEIAKELECKSISITGVGGSEPYKCDLNISISTTSFEYLLPLQILLSKIVTK